MAACKLKLTASHEARGEPLLHSPSRGRRGQRLWRLWLPAFNLLKKRSLVRGLMERTKNGGEGESFVKCTVFVVFLGMATRASIISGAVRLACINDCGK